MHVLRLEIGANNQTGEWANKLERLWLTLVIGTCREEM